MTTSTASEMRITFADAADVQTRQSYRVLYRSMEKLVAGKALEVQFGSTLERDRCRIAVANWLKRAGQRSRWQILRRGPNGVAVVRK